jgi:hypothetical protein
MLRRVGDMVRFRDLTLKCNTACNAKSCGNGYDAARQAAPDGAWRISRTLLQKTRPRPDLLKSND